ncbi:hypothetical protein Micbo1qcDRAFT_162357, partial [Microdochium bolleyi]
MTPLDDSTSRSELPFLGPRSSASTEPSTISVSIGESSATSSQLRLKEPTNLRRDSRLLPQQVQPRHLSHEPRPPAQPCASTRTTTTTTGQDDPHAKPKPGARRWRLRWPFWRRTRHNTGEFEVDRSGSEGGPQPGALNLCLEIVQFFLLFTIGMIRVCWLI